MSELPSLSPYSDEELVQLINDCHREIKKRSLERQADAERQIIEIATEHDIDLAKIKFGPKKRNPKYINPKTHETWAGLGKTPRWLRAELDAGGKLEDFEIQKHVSAEK